MKSKVINAVLFQVGWITLVSGVASGYEWIGAVYMFLFATSWIRFNDQAILSVRLLVVCLVLGAR